MNNNKKSLAILAMSVLTALTSFGFYRNIGSSTEPNTWTSNFNGVLAAAKETGYPILYIDVNSETCGHCHTLNSLTLSSSEFKALERSMVFYQVMTDDASIHTSGGTSLYNRYRSYYYGGGGYPLVAVIAKDGSVYGSFNRTVTDERNIAADIKKLLEELSMKQIGEVLHTDGTTGTSTTPSSSTPAAPVFPTTLSGWAASLKGKSNGIMFDSNEKVVGTFAMNMTARGKVSAKVMTLTGKSNIKAELKLDAEGRPAFSASGLSMTYYKESSTWIGEMSDSKILASKTSAKSYDGLYTMSAKATSGAKVGYLTVTAKNGKGRVAGLLNGRNKVSVNGVGVALPASVVADNLKTWNIGADVAIYPVMKANAKMIGCAVVTKSGAGAGVLTAFGDSWEAQGQKWDTSTSLASLNGKMVKISGYEIPVVSSSATKISAGVNAYKAKVQAQVRKGIFKGSIALPNGIVRFEGALIGYSGNIHGSGVSYGAGVYTVALGSEEECDECTVKE